MRQVIGAMLALLVAAGANPTAAGWREVRTPNFVIYSDGSERSLRASAARLEDFDQLLRRLTSTSAPPAERLAVYLVDGAGDLAIVAGDAPGIGGLYAAQTGGTAVIALRGDAPGMTALEMLQHEYAHHFMMRYHPVYYPAWYVEGFAEYVATARFIDERVEIGRPNPTRAQALTSRPWIPLGTVLSGDHHRLSGSARDQFYGESWLLVHYLFATAERGAALQRYLQALGQRVPEPIAFDLAFNRDHAALDEDLRRYRNSRLTYGSAPAPGQFAPAAVEIRSLPESADDLLLPRIGLVLGLREAGSRTELLGRVRKAAARHPSDAFARRVRARAEVDVGDRTAGVAILDALLPQAPEDAELLFLRGLAEYLTGRAVEGPDRAARYAQANPWFARASAADPTFYPAHFYFAATTRNADEALGALLRARALAPSVPNIVLAAASVLIQRQRYEDAAAALGPVAADPHGGATSTRALEMLSGLPLARAPR